MGYKIEELLKGDYIKMSDILDEHQMYHYNLKGYPYPERFLKTHIGEFIDYMTPQENMIDSSVFVCVDEQINKILGFIAIGIYDNNRADIKDFTITRDLKGKGIGKELIKTAMNWAEAKGIKSFDTHTSTGNENAINFYKKFGFQVTGKTFKKMIETSEIKPIDKRIQEIPPEEYSKLEKLYEEEKNENPKTLKNPKTFEDFLQSIEKETKIFGVKKDEEIIGYISANINEDNEKISKIFVSKEYRGKGIATKLLKNTMNYAENEGVKEFDINIENEKDIKLVEGQGFKCTGYNLAVEERIKDQEQDKEQEQEEK